LVTRFHGCCNKFVISRLVRSIQYRVSSALLLVGCWRRNFRSSRFSRRLRCCSLSCCLIRFGQNPLELFFQRFEISLVIADVFQVRGDIIGLLLESVEITETVLLYSFEVRDNAIGLLLQIVEIVATVLLYSFEVRDEAIGPLLQIVQITGTVLSNNLEICGDVINLIRNDVINLIA
jgi:hypothetical protein